MTDVRLTATNPEDSSVVPVACNSKGELLVVEPRIEVIGNDVTINGVLTVPLPTEGTGDNWFITLGNQGSMEIRDTTLGRTSFFSNRGGTGFRQLTLDQVVGKVTITNNNRAIQAFNGEDSLVYSVDFAGNVHQNNLYIRLNPDDSAQYQTLRDEESGEEMTLYVGPYLDVKEELLFLRAQVRALMEKLKMSPEGGWPVWDGSAESP